MSREGSESSGSSEVHWRDHQVKLALPTAGVLSFQIYKCGVSDTEMLILGVLVSETILKEEHTRVTKPIQIVVQSGKTQMDILLCDLY